MGISPFDKTDPVFASKRKYGNVNHPHKNCKADSLKENLKRFEFFEADVDEDYRQFLTNYDCYDNSMNDDALDNDPHYEIFLSSLIVNGNSFVLQVNEKNGLSEPLKYDAEDSCDDESLGNSRDMKAAIGGNVGDDTSDSSGGSELDSPLVFSDLAKKQRQFVVEDDIRSKPTDSNPSGNQAYLVEDLGSGGFCASGGKYKTDMQSKECSKSQILRKSMKVKKKNNDECEDDYQRYINCLRFDGENFVLKYKNASPIVYESDEYPPDAQTNNCTYNMEESTKLPATAGGSHASVMGDDNCHYIATSSSHSPFREQVMRILRKPYDLKEHQMLGQLILARKPIARNMDLRNGRDMTYSTNKDGKSYLDHHDDLRRKLQAAKTPHEDLNLLRGFFFWLQNLTQDGAFEPWLDASCLAQCRS